MDPDPVPPLPDSTSLPIADPSASSACHSIPKSWIFLFFTILRSQFERILSFHEVGELVPDVEVEAFLLLPDVVNVPKASDLSKSMTLTLSTILEHHCNPHFICELAHAHKAQHKLHRLSRAPQSSIACPTAVDIPPPPRRTLPLKRIRHFVEHNCPSKALNVVQNEVEGNSLLSYSPEVVTKLCSLFPAASLAGQLPHSDNEDDSFRVDPDQLDLFIRDLPRQSAPGMSGWTYDLIKQLCKFEALGTRQFAKGAAPFLTAMFHGHVGSNQLWVRSRVLPLEKKDGGIRPIAIGEAWVRLLSGYVARKESLKISEKALVPMQFGVATPGGSEVVIHACQLFSQLAQNPSSRRSSLAIQQIDFSNAFNCISRRAILTELEKHAPHLIPYFRWSYGTSSPLFLSSGESVGTCERGVRQGDPLGPLFFCLALHPVLAQVAQDFPDTQVVAYMDDVSLLGPSRGMLDVFQRLSELALSRCDLRVNRSKSVLFQPRSRTSSHPTPPDPDPDPDVPPRSFEGILVLGTPVGTPAFERLHDASIVSKFTAALEIVGTLESPLALPILRSCINTRATYLTRTSPPVSSHDSLRHFDDSMDQALLQVLGSSLPRLPSSARALRSLPLREGGLGLRRMDPIRERVWLVSFLAAMQSLQRLQSPLPALFHRAQLVRARPFQTFLAWAPSFFPNSFEGVPVAGEDDEDELVALMPAAWCREVSETPSQKEVCLQMDVTNKDALLTSLESDLLGRAWVLANTDRYVGHALYPNLLQPALNLPAAEHAALLNARLLMPASHASGDLEQCGHCQQVQHDGDEEHHGEVDLRWHPLVCRQMQGQRTKRHDAVVHIVKDFLSRLFGSNQVSREVSFRSLHDGPPSEFDPLRFDLRLTLPQGYLLLDVTVVCPSCTKHVQNATDPERRPVLWDSVRQAKVTKYRRALHALHLDPLSLVPLVFEANGKIEPQTAAFLQDLIKRPTADRRAATSFGFALQRIQSCLAWWAGHMLVLHHRRRITLARPQAQRRYRHNGDPLDEALVEDDASLEGDYPDDAFDEGG